MKWMELVILVMSDEIDDEARAGLIQFRGHAPAPSPLNKCMPKKNDRLGGLGMGGDGSIGYIHVSIERRQLERHQSLIRWTRGGKSTTRTDDSSDKYM